MTDDATPRWIEVNVVDGDLPMEYWADESDVVNVFAESEAHVELAVRLVYGDRYEVVEFLHTQLLEDDIKVDDPATFVETELGGWEEQINAYEVFDEAGFRVSYRVDGERQSNQAASLKLARDWYRENVDTDTSTPLYEGWTEATPDSILQRLPARKVDAYLDD